MVEMYLLQRLLKWYCNIVINSYQQNWKVLYVSPDQLPKLPSANFISLKKFSSVFFYIDAWFTDQNTKLIEIEDKISMILVNNWCITYEIKYLIKARDYLLKDDDFCLLLKI